MASSRCVELRCRVSAQLAQRRGDITDASSRDDMAGVAPAEQPLQTTKASTSLTDLPQTGRTPIAERQV